MDSVQFGLNTVLDRAQLDLVYFFMKISLKPILSNNFESIIESGANSIGTAANIESYAQSINLA